MEPDFMTRVGPVIDETIRSLAKKKFIEDSIAGNRHSRNTSIISSAYKRHGRILETALRESLRDSNRHRVWKEDVFKVSRAADQLINSQTDDECRHTTLPYGDSTIRTIQIDMIAFDEADQTIRAYEVKRGNGQFDAGKIRSIKRDILCAQVLLESYGEVFKFKPIAAESKFSRHAQAARSDTRSPQDIGRGNAAVNVPRDSLFAMFCLLSLMPIRANRSTSFR
jgi:hypothetical protein